MRTVTVLYVARQMPDPQQNAVDGRRSGTQITVHTPCQQRVCVPWTTPRCTSPAMGGAESSRRRQEADTAVAGHMAGCSRRDA